jgi:hypothetical protein
MPWSCSENLIAARLLPQLARRRAVESRLDPTYAPNAETVEVTSSYEEDEALEQD